VPFHHPTNNAKALNAEKQQLNFLNLQEQQGNKCIKSHFYLYNLRLKKNKKDNADNAVM